MLVLRRMYRCYWRLPPSPRSALVHGDPGSGRVCKPRLLRRAWGVVGGPRGVGAAGRLALALPGAPRGPSSRERGSTAGGDPLPACPPTVHPRDALVHGRHHDDGRLRRGGPHHCAGPRRDGRRHVRRHPPPRHPHLRHLQHLPRRVRARREHAAAPARPRGAGEATRRR